ncbi:methyl-accepting chemotaxis protein [Leptothrix sp. BB-4]
MIELLRRYSQANRVLAGFTLMTLMLIGLALAAAAMLRERGAADAGYALVAAAVVLGGIGMTLGWLIRASIKAPVEDTAMAVMRIAQGDLVSRIESPGRDELSWLRSELNKMRKRLSETVGGVRLTVDSVAAASEQIALGNNDLSTRTENQAAALQQTASTMDELASTVRSHAQSAQDARREMDGAREVASRGGELVGEVVERMHGIHQSANRINEIIGVIDGIAFQTNILALNAAVEAARAGEQGRGFAVVAGEVRALAQRSATAAREIKSLIGDSTEKVDAGQRLVQEAGQTMRDLLERVSRVSSLVSTMADAGSEQSRAIDQVHQAISQIDGVTQQNAALVEEVSAAAQSLKGQSGQLLEAVGAFKTQG